MLQREIGRSSKGKEDSAFRPCLFADVGIRAIHACTRFFFLAEGGTSGRRDEPALRRRKKKAAYA